MRLSISTAVAALLAASGSAAFAQTAKAPDVRRIGAITAASSDSILMLGGIRHLPNGSLIVNDVLSRRLLLLDKSLEVVDVIADTTPGSPNPYGSARGSLMPYKGDSSLFIDPSSLSMLVLDGEGRIARVMSVPRSQDAGMMAATTLGGAGFDGERMVYRSMGGMRMQAGSSPGANPGAARSGMSFSAPQMPDSMPIVRVNLATRTVDTAAFIKVSQPKANVSQGADGGMNITVEINPLPVVDEYAVLSDGRIAIVRGRDYHVEFVDRDGNVDAAPKIPFEWKRLTDEEKVAFIDSVKAQTERAAAAGGSAASRVGSNIGAAIGGGAPVVMTQTRVVAGGAGGEPPMRGAPTVRAMASQVNYVSPSELPDYQPAFFGNQARGDMDGNLWVRIIPPKPIAGGAVYDVIDGKGELVDRVQVPLNRTIAGFGAGGVVYLTSQENGITKLERATFK